MTTYPQSFKQFISRCSEKCNGNILAKDFYIGRGNPMSPILFVGQEPSGEMLLEMGKVIREHLEHCKIGYIFA